MRLLITGSRDWDDKDIIVDRLWDIYLDEIPIGEDLIIVHGKCPTGADAIASEWVQRVAPWAANGDIFEEPHPADWQAYGKAAGFKRNTEMAVSKPDRGLAYIKNASRGATHCYQEALKAGVPMELFEVTVDD